MLCLFICIYASKLSYRIVTKIQWKVKFVELLEVDHDIIEFRIRLNKFCLLMNKETIKSKNKSFLLNAKFEIITPCRNNEKVDRYVTPYETFLIPLC